MIENKSKLEDIEKVQTHTFVLENLDLSTMDTLKDQNGQNIKQSETSEDSLEKSVKNLKAKSTPSQSHQTNAYLIM